MHYFNKITLLCFLLLFAQNSFAKIINLPEDYPSIQEAIENAESGDEIHVNQHGVYMLRDQSELRGDKRKGIRIENKNLRIIGKIPNERTNILKYKIFTNSALVDNEHEYGILSPSSPANLIVIQNSDVELVNLEMNDIVEFVSGFYASPRGVTAAPIQVISGTL